MFAKKKNIFRGLIDRGNIARDRKQYGGAAALYSEALRLRPDLGHIHVQCGHMYKESGDLDKAEEHYLAAMRLMPDDADLNLQLGHFYKTAGRADQAEIAYRRALELQPNWADALRELGNLYHAPSEIEAEAAKIGLAEVIDELVPELVPQEPESLLHTHREYIDVRRLGRHENNRWGNVRTLRGIEAIRGFCISASPISELQISLGTTIIYRGPCKGPYTLAYEINKERVKKYVFNIWHDFSDTPPGGYVFELRFTDGTKRPRVHRERVVVAAPIPEAEYPGSDALVELPPGGEGSLDDRINLRPSMVRQAARRLFADPPRNILVQRTDQLGDMVCSIPALRRLRQTFPSAHIVGLLTSGNADLGRTLGLFDEIMVIDFPDDRWERRRIMPLEVQKELRDRLAPYKFDLAIDLAESSVSRPLLRLSGAKFLFGFREREFSYLTAGYEGNTRDRLNAMEIAPHSTKVLAAIERLSGLTVSHADTIRRDDLSRDRLETYGLGKDDRFVVLHLGARIKYSRWPGYFELAAMLLERSDVKIVMMADDPEVRGTVPAELFASDRFQFIDRLLPFDDFDALLSFCSGFVGNDSGPKHLASLRGANVVSIHMARNNWAEWGQEHSGMIVSRKVPCAGCALYYEPEECGKDFACITNIKADEVYSALDDLMRRNRQAA